MSRIGRMPISIPAGVDVKIEAGNLVTVKGPKGTLTQQMHPAMTITQEGDVIHVTRPNDEKANRSLHGLTRTLLHNMVVGVTDGYKKELEVNGVGYRVQKQGKNLVMNLGYSHPVEMTDPEGLEGEAEVQLAEQDDYQTGQKDLPGFLDAACRQPFPHRRQRGDFFLVYSHPFSSFTITNFL